MGRRVVAIRKYLTLIRVMRFISGTFFLTLCLSLTTWSLPVRGFETELRPPVRDIHMPRTRWTHQPDHLLWNGVALAALKSHGKPLTDMVPRDIAEWCPKYPQATDDERRAFWLGFMSALAKFESTFKPRAIGGGGQVVRVVANPARHGAGV